MCVLQIHCKVGQGSSPLKILRNYGIGERVLSQSNDFQYENVHPREVMLTFLNLPSFIQKKNPDKLFMNFKKVHSKDSLLFPQESYKCVLFLFMDQASRQSGLELLQLNGEFKARSPARRLCFNFPVEGTGVVVELNCKEGEGSDPLRILRNQGVGTPVLW